MSSPIDKKFRVGLVGAGYVCKYHIRALQDLRDVAIIGICDADFNRAVAMQKAYRLPAAYRDLNEMRASRPDVIHILTPPGSHCNLSLQALRMGCHVFVEKPMATSVEECDRMIAAAQRAQRVLSVNHSARMDPVILKALQLVQRGACGKVLAVDFLRASDYPPYAGGPLPQQFTDAGYPFLDIGVHGLSVLESFLGPIRDIQVQRRATGYDPALTFDEWHALIDCRNGTGHLYLSWNVKPFQNEWIIHGTHGVLHVDCFLQTCSLRRRLGGPKIASRIVSAAANSLSTLGGVAWNVARFATGRLTPSPGIGTGIAKFYQALREQTPPPVSAEEGRRALFWVERATQAAVAERQQMRKQDVMPPQPARVLVTGATGMLGGSLLDRLLGAGEPIRVLARRGAPSLPENPRVHVVRGDLGDPDAVDRAVAGVEVVYHVGAAMRGCAADFERGTVWGTRNVVAACLRHRVKRLVYVSSLTVLDHAGNQPRKLVTELSPLEPYPNLRGVYTQAKLKAEQIVLDAIHAHDLPAVILRPAQILGRGAEVAPPAGAIALRRRWIVVGNGALPLHLNYVDDVVDALLLAASRDGICGRIFHLAEDHTVTQREYIDACRVKVPELAVSYVPGMLVYTAAWMAELLGSLLRRQVPLSRYRVRSLTPLANLDGAAAREGLGWTPAIAGQAGLRRTFRQPAAGSAETRVPEPI